MLNANSTVDTVRMISARFCCFYHNHIMEYLQLTRKLCSDEEGEGYGMRMGVQTGKPAQTEILSVFFLILQCLRCYNTF